MIIGSVSDSHLREYTLAKKVKVLVHAGDHTFHGNMKELTQAIEQLKVHKTTEMADYIITIAGNHDRDIQKNSSLYKNLFKEAGIIYLQDELVTIEGITFYGAPWTPEFCGWAFATHQFDHSEFRDPEEVWGQVPEGIDVLVTHGPSWGRFDVPFGGYNHVGCPTLMRHIQRIKPRVHIFGHVHSPGDIIGADGIRHINASVCNGLYERRYEPTIFELEPNPLSPF